MSDKNQQTPQTRPHIELLHVSFKNINGKRVLDEIAVHNPHMILLYKTLPIHSEKPL